MMQKGRENMTITFDKLISDSNDFRRDVLEFGENVGTKFADLWDTLLDTDDGISEEAYSKLVEYSFTLFDNLNSLQSCTPIAFANSLNS